MSLIIIIFIIYKLILYYFIFLDRSFLVANAQQAGCNIIYCSDGFCHMTGYSRAEVMQCPAICDFLHGPMTSQHAVSVVKEALAAGMERHFEILYYRKDGKWYINLYYIVVFSFRFIIRTQCTIYRYFTIILFLYYHLSSTCRILYCYTAIRLWYIYIRRNGVKINVSSA